MEICCPSLLKLGLNRCLHIFVINKLTTQSILLLLLEKQSWNKLLGYTKGKNREAQAINTLLPRCLVNTKVVVHSYLDNAYIAILVPES